MIVSVFLASLGINDNEIISEIPHCIPSSPNLWYVVNTFRKDTFMRILGFVCNYPCSMSLDKEERDGLGRMVKDIAFWDGE